MILEQREAAVLIEVRLCLHAFGSRVSAVLRCLSLNKLRALCIDTETILTPSAQNHLLKNQGVQADSDAARHCPRVAALKSRRLLSDCKNYSGLLLRNLADLA